MTRIGRFLAVCMIGLGAAASAVPAFSAPVLPASPVPAVGGVTLAQWGPPPRWDGRPPQWGSRPPHWGHRPPHWGHRPPHWSHRPPPGWRHRPPRYYRPGPPPRVHPWGSRPSAHVRWCLNRYRSYNPSTDRYLGNSGYYRVCVSPYSR